MGGEVWGNEEQLQGLWKGAVTVENPALTYRPNLRQLTLRLRNSSAIRFQLRLREAPAWLAADGAELLPEGGAGISARINKEAQAGEQSVELQFEVTNLHVAPDRNLSIRLPLKIIN